MYETLDLWYTRLDMIGVMFLGSGLYYLVRLS